MRKFSIVFLVVLLGCMFSYAETFEHKDAGISIWFPDNWKIDTEEEGILMADAPDEEAFAQLMVLEDAETLDAAIDALVQELDPIVKDFKLTTEGEEVDSNGLKFYIVEGEGKVDDVKMGVSLALIATQQDSICMMVMFCPEVFYKKYEKSFTKIVQSIKAI